MYGRLHQDERLAGRMRYNKVRECARRTFFDACGDMRVLVIEDDPDLNKQLCNALGRAGYIAESARDGEQGHFLADTSDFDAVILDLGLPVMKGTEVLRKWRDAGRTMPRY
jgi:CheY-like chemotaxis protein